MTQLAIKGHRTRGSEIIELLEMLGGINWPYSKYFGNEPTLVYYINNHGYIFADEINDSSRCTIYTLEEFLEKFPYKVGDKVLYHDSKAYIKSMKWGSREIIYTVEWEKELWETTVFYLKPYKEAVEENLTIQDIKDNNAEWLLNKLEAMSVKKALQTISDLYDKLRKPKYPKTFVECCEILYPNENFQLIALPFKGHNYKQLFALQKLLVCRDAYWKIAGEQMGLGKPWEPDWESLDKKYNIYNYRGVISSNFTVIDRCILVFPTEEMRVAFNENFKELIEACRDFL